MNIGYIGLSHLGINHVAASAVKGFKVIGYDKDEKMIKDLKQGKINFYEKNLERNLLKNRKIISFTNKVEDLNKCDLIFFSQDVPTNLAGKSDIKKIKKLIFPVLKKLNKEATLVILSQVPPGFTERINWKPSKLYYQVETLIFSKAQQRALFPERIIVGRNLNNKFDSSYFRYLKKFSCPIIEMNFRSAELAKISINIFLISQVTSTNLLSEISENIGGDWNKIKESLQFDRRIGKYSYLLPGLGISGGNLERDLKTTLDFSVNNKNFKDYLESIIKISEYRKDWIYRKFKNTPGLRKIKNIGILGLSYKEGTNSIKNSPALRFIKKIKNKKFKIYLYDPKVKYFKNNLNLNFCNKSSEVLYKSELILFCTPWKKFKEIQLDIYKNIKVIIDPYNIFKNFKSKKFKYISMG